jgi:cation diffusion facilitator family transporter
MSTSGGTRAIIAALLANLGIAVTKALLLLGGRRAQRKATPQHPFGYGRDRYIYAFIVSIVLFSVGGLFALYEAWHKFQHPEGIHRWQWVPVLVLLVAIVLESFSFRTAIKESNHVRGRTTWVQFVRRARAPELPVVLLEDLGALVGLVFALIGVSMTLITGDGEWDAAGTAAIGILLVTIAIILAVETKSLLLGESATPEDIEKIERIIHMKTLHLGPEELLVAAKIAIRGHETGEDIARLINATEARIREAVPIARVIYLEPDIYHVPAEPTPAAG